VAYGLQQAPYSRYFVFCKAARWKKPLRAGSPTHTASVCDEGVRAHRCCDVAIVSGPGVSCGAHLSLAVAGEQVRVVLAPFPVAG
jgi:hypothetical protein